MPRTLRNLTTGDRLAELLDGGGSLSVIPGRGLVPRRRAVGAIADAEVSVPRGPGFSTGPDRVAAQWVEMRGLRVAARVRRSEPISFAVRLGSSGSTSTVLVVGDRPQAV